MGSFRAQWSTMSDGNGRTMKESVIKYSSSLYAVLIDILCILTNPLKASTGFDAKIFKSSEGKSLNVFISRKGAEGIEDSIIWLVTFLCVFCVLIVNS